MKRMMKILAIAIVLVVCVMGIFEVHSARMRRIPAFKDGVFVYDLASIINKEDTKILKGLLDEVEFETDANVYVVSMSSSKKCDVEAYADKAFAEMGLVKYVDDKIVTWDENVLICFSKNQKEVAVRTTQGLADVLNEGKIASILSKYYDPYVEEDHSYAIQNSVTSMVMVISSHYDADVTNLRFSSPYSSNPFVDFAVIMVLIIGGLISIIKLMNGKRR